MRIFLAPMEGVVDALMRELLTNFGGIDVCVTEFLRVNKHLYPDKVFYQRCPELHNRSLTPNGTPVRLQLLGGDPDSIANNAVKAVHLGASAIDLNFGCPAKTVNKSEGGAFLLKTPSRLENIISATRNQVPKNIPVTAKIRLGFEDRSLYLDNAQAAYSGGATELTVHARSKADGYHPPAYWDYIAEIRQSIPIPVIANGEIWSLEDFKRCKAVTGCDQFMLGRGLLSCPDLASQIKQYCHGQKYQKMQWQDLSFHLEKFFVRTTELYETKYTGNRLKQWLHYLSRQYPQAQTLFQTIKRSRKADEILKAIDLSRKSLEVYI